MSTNIANPHLARHDQSSATRKRAQKLDKLFQTAMTAKGIQNERDTWDELAARLCHGYEAYDPLERILDALNSTLIPQVYASRTDGALSERVNDASNSLMHMVIVLHTLAVGHRTEALKSYEDRAYRMIVERWREITRWMIYLLSCEVCTKPEGKGLALTCSQALVLLCGQANGNSYKEELLAQDITVSVLTLLLLQKDNQTGRFWDFVLCSETSMLSRLLQRYCESEVARRTLIVRLAAVSKGARLSILETVVVRAREAVSHFETANLVGVAASLCSILDAATRLADDEEVYRIFEERGFLVSFTRDLCLLSEKASTIHEVPFTDRSFWRDISSAVQSVSRIAFMYTSHPSRRIAKMIEAGILGCAFRCLASSASSSDPMAAVLRSVLPYLYYAKAVLVRHSAPEPAIFLQETPHWSRNALEIWSVWKKILYKPNAFLNWKDKEMRRCNNIMIPISRAHGLAIGATLLSTVAQRAKRKTGIISTPMNALLLQQCIQRGR